MVGIGWEIVGYAGVTEFANLPAPSLKEFGGFREFILYLNYWNRYTDGAYLPCFRSFFQSSLFRKSNGMYIIKRGTDLSPEELQKSWEYANELLYPYAKQKPRWKVFSKMRFAKLRIEKPIPEILDYIKRWRDIVYEKLELVGHTDDGRPVYRLWSRRLVKLYKVDPRLIALRKCVYDYWNRKWLP